MAKKLSIAYLCLVAILLVHSHAEIDDDSIMEVPSPAPSPSPSPSPSPAPSPALTPDPTPDQTPTEPTPSDPTPSDPTPSDPTPTDPTPSDPTPTDPTPTDGSGTTEGSLKPEECDPHCEYRCSKTHHKKPCLFYCKKCCATCLCVPAGTYGNKETCPCYNNWKTQEGGPKCP